MNKTSAQESANGANYVLCTAYSSSMNLGQITNSLWRTRGETHVFHEWDVHLLLEVGLIGRRENLAPRRGQIFRPIDAVICPQPMVPCNKHT